MEKFIGTVEVRSSKGSDTLAGANGAFVNVVCLLDSVDHFHERVRSEMKGFRLEVVAISDVGKVSDRLQKDDLVPELRELAENLSVESPIRFDEFQTFTED